MAKHTKGGTRQPSDEQLALRLFTTLLPEPSWANWQIFVAALFGLPLSPEQAAVYEACTGRQQLPTQRAREGWVIAGRRSGKTRAASALAAWAATVPRYKLARGERGVVLLLGADRRQAGIAKSYISAMLKQLPASAAMVAAETKDTISLSNHIIIEVGTSSYRLIRGRTVVCAILDELCYWPSDEHSAEPDKEALVAVRPSLATVNGLLLCLSSPHRQVGQMYDAFRRLYGNDSRPEALCWKAPTSLMNELIPAALMDQARAEDASAAASEWDAEWRADLEDLVSLDTLDALTATGRRELPPMAGTAYIAFCDPSGGSTDSMTLGIGHRNASGRAILDCLRERCAPPSFSPAEVVAEFARVLRSYGLSVVTGDRFTGQWCSDEFRRCGITYQFSERAASEIYLDAVALMNSGGCELLDDARLRSQLLSLERRVGRSGRDAVTHRQNTHDDRAVVACGVLTLAATSAGLRASWPAEFTECVNFQASAAERCVLLARGPLLPADPYCHKHCSGLKVAKAAYQAHQRQGGELPIAAFLKERFERNEMARTIMERRALDALGL